MRLAGVAALALASLAACASPERRIKAHQAEFDTYPAEVQEKIRAGRVDVGFTKPQVSMAMGEPDRKYERKTETSTQEVWSYREVSPGVGLSLGAATGGYGSTYGGGVAVGGPPERLDEKARIVFEGDKVVSVESRKP